MKYTRAQSVYHVCILLTVLSLVSLCWFPMSAYAKIVFASKRNGDTLAHIYVMEDNGHNVRRITGPTSYDRHPYWFPDGKRILFQRFLEPDNNGFNSVFRIIDEKGGEAYSFMENHPTDYWPALSPDGKQIAFRSMREAEWDIWTFHLESGSLRQLTHNFDKRASSTTVEWSPDGRQLAYEHASEVDGDNIWTMTADGKNKSRLSPPRRDVPFLNRGAPLWSPSGTYIMYAEIIGEFGVDAFNNGTFRKDVGRIVIQNVYTRRRTEHEFPVSDNVHGGCWMGDDRTVLLPIRKNSSAPGAHTDIYRYDLITRQLTNLTNQPGGDNDPHWISGTLAVLPAGKLTIQWGQLKQRD